MNTRDFHLVIPTSEIANETGVLNIKRELYNALPWISDFCKDKKLLERENLYDETIEIIRYFERILIEERRDIHDYASCVFRKITQYETEIIFKGYQFE